MNLALKPETRRLIKQKLESGRYASAEQIVEAGLAALEQQESFGNFAPGELNDLLAEGERSIQRDGVVPAEEVFAELRRRSKARQQARRAR